MFIMEDCVCICVCVFVLVRVCIYACVCVCGSNNFPGREVGALKFRSNLRTTSLYTVPHIIIIGPREPVDPRGSHRMEC